MNGNQHLAIIQPFLRSLLLIQEIYRACYIILQTFNQLFYKIGDLTKNFTTDEVINISGLDDLSVLIFMDISFIILH